MNLSVKSTALATLLTRFPRAKALTTLLGLELPIIQAPMAGADNQALALRVAALGAMGSRGMGYTSAQHIHETIVELRAKTTHYQLNLFIPDASFYAWSRDDIEKRIELLQHHLQPYPQQLGLTQLPFEYNDIPQLFSEQLDVVLQERIPCLSFAFGRLSQDAIIQCHQQGIKVIGTATTVAEAIALAQDGCDAIVVQGLEAGGHRGGFSPTQLTGQQPLMTLLTTLNKVMNIPMIAAGGIRDAAQVYACLLAGASGVQIGSALLVCEDNTSISTAYQQLMRHAAVDTIQITPAISGRCARGIHNSLFAAMQTYYDCYPTARLPYPFPHLLTTPLRQAANQQNNAEWIAAWCGASVIPFKESDITSLIANLIDEVATYGA